MSEKAAGFNTISHRLDYTDFHKISSSCDFQGRERNASLTMVVAMWRNIYLGCGCCCYEGWKTFSISNQFQSTKVSRKWTNFTAWTVFFSYSYMLSYSIQWWTMNSANISEWFYRFTTDDNTEFDECKAVWQKREKTRKFSSLFIFTRVTLWGIINWMTNCFRSFALIRKRATVMYLSI